VISRLFFALCLMAASVAIHAAGLSWALRQLRRVRPPENRFWAWTRVFVFAAGWLVLLHLAEIAIWAFYYVWRDAMPDLASALYFSSVTYTTTGYGDLVLPESWRLIGGVEALTGILLCGWSTGFFFAVVNRLYMPAAEVAR
jgi:hypothetical protein